MEASNEPSNGYDLVVLGCGEAGKYIAWTLARQGKRTLLIERRYVGGSCPNIACLPTKNVIHGAKVANLLRHSEGFGLKKKGFEVDMPAVRERKRAMVQGLVDVHLANFKTSGAELLMGTGRFVGPKTIEVERPDGTKRTVTGEKVIVSTGSRATIDATPGLKDSHPLTHIEALELDVVPEHLVVLGGGYIGLEMAQAYRRFGSKVTIVERNVKLLHREDADVTDFLHQLCKDEGIEVKTNVKVTSVEGTSGESVTLHLAGEGGSHLLKASHLLVAGGRTPNTDGIGLESAGIERTERGFVRVNQRLETSASGVFAVGDCAGSPHFTHVAFDDFRIVRDNLAGGSRTAKGRIVPFCLFTDPEFARIGLSETEAAAEGISYRLAKIPMAAVLRSRTLSETKGFMKALVDPITDKILGAAIIGPNAGEVIATVQMTMSAGLPYMALRDAVLTHPTMAEGLCVLFANVAAAK